jgi:hypothetical protein
MAKSAKLLLVALLLPACGSGGGGTTIPSGPSEIDGTWAQGCKKYDQLSDGIFGDFRTLLWDFDSGRATRTQKEYAKDGCATDDLKATYTTDYTFKASNGDLDLTYEKVVVRPETGTEPDLPDLENLCPGHDFQVDQDNDVTSCSNFRPSSGKLYSTYKVTGGNQLAFAVPDDTHDGMTDDTRATAIDTSEVFVKE